MKTRIAASTLALTISLYGITPALAGSFNDSGPDIRDWPVASQTLRAQPDEQSQTAATYYSQGFSKGSAFIAPPASNSTPKAQSCNLSPSIGFNQSTNFPTC